MWGLILGIILGVIALIAILVGVYFVKKTKYDKVNIEYEKVNVKGKTREEMEQLKNEGWTVSERDYYNSPIEMKRQITKEQVKWKGKAITIGATSGVVAGGVIAGMFTIFGGLHSVKNNEIAIVRNSVNGNIRVAEKAGLGLYSPFESLHRMTTTQVDYTFGNDDPEKGVAGYIPFNDKTGNEFNASVYVQWEADKSSLTDTIMKLYRITGDTNIKADMIISTIRAKASNFMTEFVNPTHPTVDNQPAESTTIPSLKTQMSTILKTELPKELEQFGIKLTQVVVKDIIAPKNIIEQVKATSEAATKTQVAQREVEAAKQQLEVEKARQAISSQTALNKMLENQYIATEVIKALSKLSTPKTLETATPAEVYSAIAGIQNLGDLIKQDQYFEKWNGQLPQVMGQSQAGVMLGLPTK